MERQLFLKIKWNKATAVNYYLFKKFICKRLFRLNSSFSGGELKNENLNKEKLADTKPSIASQYTLESYTADRII